MKVYSVILVANGVIWDVETYRNKDWAFDSKEVLEEEYETDVNPKYDVVFKETDLK